MGRLNNTLLNYSWVKEEILGEIKSIFKEMKMKTQPTKFGDVAKAEHIATLVTIVETWK